MHGIETAYTASGDGSFRTTGYDSIGLTQTDEVKRIGNGICGSGTCRTSCVVGTMEFIHDGNLSGSNVRNHLGDEERIEFGAVFLTGQGIVARLFFECTDATDTGAEDDTDSV